MPLVRGGFDLRGQLFGMNLARVWATSLISWEGVTLLAHHAVCWSTNAAASGVRSTVVCAITLARHGITSPIRTPAHSWGRR
ncbi:hypothetical protein [Nocardioides sp.]|uniref:hypothetical protein n=1 Tax=Nocardioides sp. TaxID=35761 RepID=UPI002BB5207A|nr:hypothetical protein [Nocardioides sp.]HXH76927.1 hypothetical protein [Nocardioides sp.]